MRILERFVAATSMLGLLLVASCKALTDPKARLDSFEWQAIENSENVVEGMDAVGFAGDVDLVGQLTTPTLCFNLAADFTRSGSTLQLHVIAKPASTSTNCSQTAGGYQYTAALRAVGAGDYTVKVVHSVPGEADREYTKDVAVN